MLQVMSNTDNERNAVIFFKGRGSRSGAHCVALYAKRAWTHFILHKFSMRTKWHRKSGALHIPIQYIVAQYAVITVIVRGGTLQSGGIIR
jgi:hypothetical protein